ncbi:hypothetical protein LOZ64_000076 [Ophidiomyces ophidiicola]|nr:hypothetical protein LOZ64_000076 [Ophidiomyces ophidiicola]KAI2001773.1 hypothetical protein LOZ49_006531 [Ophidiomyces ophidiicola]KAI2021822.1 hypothetical protein LOZ46_002243 [Ophidiomyces ophidiicola]KAI2039522.1 hypothetical protein LOZ47_002159 [Ophidiomyces ophidiicola]KAI2056693.1 hypothetical protein LOZ44_001964 [Ophidiomyces ophidiicola]
MTDISPRPCLTTPFPSKSHVPFSHIIQATWASLVTLILGSTFILIIAFTTNNKPTTTGIWVSNAPVFISLGGIIIKGSLGALLGVALYQHLWSLLAVPDANGGHQNDGLKLKEVESLHLASRLAVGMLVAPSARVGWFLGFAGLLCTGVVVPVLQAGVKVVTRVEMTPTDVSIPHAQLDYRMATTGTALNSPEGARPNVKRSAITAVFGETVGYSYTKQNVSGKATFGEISYTDIECNVVITAGTVPLASSTEYYYNFTHTFTEPIKNGSIITAYGSLNFRATLNNNTHYLVHSCVLHPATGKCSTTLAGGIGIMKDLRCKRSSWINPVPHEINGPSAGFVATAAAFISVFEGAAWSSTQGRPQENSTFIEASARWTNRTSYILSSDLISHMQRTLWNIPIGARPLDVPESEIGGGADPNGTVVMRVQDERNVLIMTMNYRILIPVVGIATLMGILSVTYLVIAPNRVLGRLMRDSLVHTLTVGGRWGPGIRGACILSLETLLRQVGQERYIYGVIDPASPSTAGTLGLKELGGAGPGPKHGDPLEGLYYGGR